MAVVYVSNFPICDTFDDVLALPDSTPFAACLESGRQCMYFPVAGSDPRTWTRWAGKITSIDHGSALDMSSGVLTIQDATLDNPGTMSAQRVLDLITAQADLATARQDLSDLTNNFNLLLKFVITQFNEIPDGLESSFEDAMSAV